MEDYPTLIFMYGYPASGKSTYSEKFIKEHPDFILLSADKIREEVYGSQDKYGDPYTMYLKILSRMRDLLKENKNVIYDAANLKSQYRLDYLLKIQDIECYKKIICLIESKEVCIERHINRKRNIAVEKLLPYFEINEFPVFSEGWDEIQVHSPSCQEIIYFQKFKLQKER